MECNKFGFPFAAALLSYSLLPLATVAPIAVADCYENDLPCVFDYSCCSGYCSYANGLGEINAAMDVLLHLFAVVQDLLF
ncbi:hypothetical protein V6N13_038211 [Hibiscus sabdariffa]